MRFDKWLATQDTRKWGVIDEATRQCISEDFKFRRIAARPEQMSVWFWDDVEVYGQRYIDQLRLELANQTMDPLINRYFESVLVADRSNTGTGTVTDKGTVKRSGNRTENTLHTGTNTIDHTFNEQVGDNTTVTTDHGAREETKTLDTQTDNIHGAQSESTEYGSSVDTRYGKTDTTSFTGRTHDKEISGTRIKHTEGDGKGNYEETSGTDTTRHGYNYSDTTTQSGSQETTVDQGDATRTRSANKATPMSPVGVTHESSAESGGYGRALDGQLAELDFKYASAYQETGTVSGQKSTTTDTFKDRTTVVKRSGNENDNTDATAYGKKTEKGTDITETESFGNYKESTREAGTEQVAQSGNDTQKKTGTDTVTRTEYTDTETRTGTETMGYKSYQDSETTNGTTTKTGTNTDTEERNLTDNLTGESNDNTETDMARESTNSATENSKQRNRYMGREGLTVQEGLQSAIRYLQTMSPAIRWFEGILEHNLLGLFYFDDYCEEDDYE